MTYFEIPVSVQENAEEGLNLKRVHNFKGSTDVGIQRAVQLSTNTNISITHLANMRTWFARHGPDAKNGGTSYPGYCAWMKLNKPTGTSEKNKHRGAVSWLLWGGDAAYLWLKSEFVRRALRRSYPNRKESVKISNLRGES